MKRDYTASPEIQIDSPTQLDAQAARMAAEMSETHSSGEKDNRKAKSSLQQKRQMYSTKQGNVNANKPGIATSKHHVGSRNNFAGAKQSSTTHRQIRLESLDDNNTNTGSKAFNPHQDSILDGHVKSKHVTNDGSASIDNLYQSTASPQ